MAVVGDFTALLGGAHWASVHGQATSDTPVIITYSFPTTFPQAYLTQYGAVTAATFKPFDAADQAEARLALDAWASVSGITFVEVPDAMGDVRFLWIDGLTAPTDYQNIGGTWGGQGNAPYAPFYLDAAADRAVPVLQQYWIDQGYNYGLSGATAYNTLYDNGRDPVWMGTLLHEIGHALGFKHPHDGDVTLAAAADKTSNTVMSYNRDSSATVLGPFDIQAAQHLYGAPNRDGTQLAQWRYDPATVSFQLTGGAGDDVIRGTSVRDVVMGGAGDDAIAGWFGNDRLAGGPGDDQIGGGAGLDTAVFNVARAGAAIRQGSVWWTSVTSNEGIDWVAEVERFQFTDVILAFDAAGAAGQAYRLYQAAFARTPDRSGLSYWIDRIDDGMSLRDVARGFIGSAEFRSAYGANASAEAYVAKFYENVLGRAGEAGGSAYWSGELRRGVPLAEVLIGFSESPENVARLAPVIGQGVELDPGFFA